MDRSAIMLKDLYDSEINFSISSFWDAGFEVKLGDDLTALSRQELPRHSTRRVIESKSSTGGNFENAIFAADHDRATEETAMTRRPQPDDATLAQFATICEGLSPLESALLLVVAMRAVYGGTWKIAADSEGVFSIVRET